MNLEMLQLIELVALAALLSITILILRRLNTQTGGASVEGIVGGIEKVRQSQVDIDRAVRDEFSRSRQESAALNQSTRSELVTSLSSVGESLTSTVTGLVRANDHRFEALRSSLEQRFDAFGAESARRMDQLTGSISDRTTGFQNDVTAQLAHFKSALDVSVRETNELQRRQSQAVTEAFQQFQSALDERQSSLQLVLDARLTNLAQSISQQLELVQESMRASSKVGRDEAALSFQSFSTTLKTDVTELRNIVDARLGTIQSENEKKLEQMRQTVDEKLQGTLEARLGESFKQVSDRLEQVYRGLGEMQTLATGVGDLKRVLTNVKTRGTWGEMQLGALLEQILAPEQYGSNVATTGTNDRVEFAIKLPGQTDGAPLWLPIDAKFPMEDYQRLVDASERGDADATEGAGRQLEATLKLCARAISEKYIAAPLTTDFGILFLSTEGLYAEAMRRPGLVEFIMREYRVALTGPSTLAALLNTFQMGFRTLAIQQRSSEVWNLLSVVKTEFGKYADVLGKVKKKLGEAQNTIESAETRTRAIQRKLRNVEEAEDSPAPPVLADVDSEVELLEVAFARGSKGH